MKASDQYLKIVEWSEEDQCYIGTCPGLMFGGVHGDNEENVYRELCKVVGEWIKIIERDGDPLPSATAQKKYSGKFVLRVGQELHKELSIDAMRRGESLNSYCLNVFREHKHRTRYSKRSLRKRRGSAIRAKHTTPDAGNAKTRA